MMPHRLATSIERQPSCLRTISAFDRRLAAKTSVWLESLRKTALPPAVEAARRLDPTIRINPTLLHATGSRDQ